MINNLDIDIENEISKNNNKTITYSVISIILLAILLLASKYRMKIIYRHKIEIKSILEIISLQSMQN